MTTGWVMRCGRRCPPFIAVWYHGFCAPPRRGSNHAVDQSAVPDLDRGLAADPAVAGGGDRRADHGRPVRVPAMLGVREPGGRADRVAHLVLDVPAADVAVVGAD